MEDSEFGNFLSLDNFRLAWQRITRSERLEVKDRLALKVYAADLDRHLEILIAQIRQGAYNPEPAGRIYKPKKARTLRPFPFLSMQDRLVYQAFGNVIGAQAYDKLSEYADRRIFAHVLQEPGSNFQLKPGKSCRGIPGQYEKFRTRILEEKGNNRWNVKTDIAAFYPSIDHELLLQTLRDHGWLTHPDLLDILEQCLAAWASHVPHLRLSRGVPIGYETSDVLATLFLLDVDEAMVEHGIMLRYVDDMYLFAPDRARVTHALIELDRLIQSRGLILQTSKTEFEEFSNTGEDEEQRIELELQKRLSMISVDLDGNPEDNERAQNNLRKMFYEFWTSGQKQEILQKYEAKIAFILYRLKIKDERIKQAALYLLDELPDRSIHITQYLSMFAGDRDVIDKLLTIVEDDLAYEEIRANCLRALKAVWVDITRIRDIARRWVSSEDSWYLRLIGADLLQNSGGDFNLLRRCAREEADVNVRALALAACFSLSTTNREQADIIRQALADKSDYIKALGAYLWRRESELDWASVNPRGVPQELLPLISFTDDTQPAIMQEASKFRTAVKSLFRFEIHPELPLEKIFEDVAAVAQALLDANDAKQTNPNGLVEALTNFGRALLVAALKTQDIQNLTGLSLQELVNIADEEIVDERIGQLLVYSGRLPNPIADRASVLSGSGRQAMKISKAGPLIRDVSVFSARIFLNFHQEYRVPIPKDLRQLAQVEERSLVFISHAREDDTFAMELRQVLNSNSIDTWLDVDDIAEGAKWDDEVQEGLNKSWAMVVIVSPDSMDSNEVKNEINYAESKRFPIIPLLYRNCDSSDVFNNLYRIARNNWIEVKADQEQAMRQCADALREEQNRQDQTGV